MDATLDRRPSRCAASPPDAIADAAAGTALRVERIGLAAAARLEAPWRDLLARALEPNVFLDPAFVLPLARHACGRRAPRFLLAWTRDAVPRLAGLLPLEPGGSRGGLVRGFRHPQVALGVPLLDAALAAPALRALLDAAAARHPRAAGLMLTAVPCEGRFAAALRALHTADGRPVATFDRHARAMLPFGPVEEAPASARHRKEMRRLRRRLDGLGRVAYASARTPQAVGEALERFLALEGSGWKGRRRTALGAQPGLAAFARAMTLSMAERGRCRIDSLELDGRPVAMGILLQAGGRSHFWKTAFDERHAALSPGVQFTLELTARQGADPAIAATDSCAVAGHPMIDRLWPQRMAVADVVVALQPPSGRAAAGRWRRTLAREGLRRRLRATAKGVAQTIIKGVARTVTGSVARIAARLLKSPPRR